MKRTDFFKQWYNWYAIASLIWIAGILFNEFVSWRTWTAQDWATWFGAIGTFLAFVGTIYLAQSETRRREQEQIDRNVGAGSRAIFTIFSIWNTLEQYRKEVLEPFRQRPDAWLNLAANPAFPIGEHRFDADALQFLLQSEHAQAYAALFLEEQRFSLAIQLIRARSELVLNEVFTKMAEAGFEVGKQANLEDVEKILGIDLSHKLKEITSAIFRNVDEDLASLKAVYEDVRGAMKALYPGRKVLQVVFDLQNN